MTKWKLLMPSPEDLAAVRRVAPGDVFIDTDAEPSWTSIYLRREGSGWLSLSWDSQDVAFRFEIFCLSIGLHTDREFKRLQAVANVPVFSEIRFLVRTSWLRPAAPGEVPDHFVQQVEESGRSSEVPQNYIEAGTTLDGVVFVDREGNPLMTITVVNSTDYLVSVAKDAETIASRMSGCDVMSLDEVLHWSPPVVE